jgi:AcrR family transcriptional regulator
MPSTDQPDLLGLRRTPTQRRSLERLHRALDAADRLVAAEGVDALTTTTVAREADISVGSLYQYFPDREAIITALASRYLAGFDELVEQVVEAASREIWPDPIGVVLDAFVARWRSEPGYRALWLGSQLPPQLVEADRDNNRLIADAARRILVGQGHLPDTPELARRCWVAVLCCDALLREAFRADPEGDPELRAEAGVVLRGYLLDPADASADPSPKDPR